MSAALYCGGEAGPTPGHPGVAPIEGFEAELRATQVLVIEDDAVIAWTMESLLADMGFAAIAVAPTGSHAIAAARAHAPGLIISDINLGPGIDGIDAVSAIVPGAAAHVIFVTAYATEAARERIEGCLPGAAVLRKPVRAPDLRASVIAVLKARRQH
ncbi:MAG: response regulator [Croceibacterium sp.]